jgi:sulfite exporter TauE/SafE
MPGTDLSEPLVLAPLASALAAALVGFGSSLHCFVMCGPLACAALPAQGSRFGPVAAYHFARLAAYALLGGLLGLFGSGVGRLLTVRLAPVAPWLLVATLLASALELGRRLSPPPLLTQIVRRLGALARRLPGSLRAAVLGALTPLLPCGLLYGLFAAAVAEESFGGGALLLAAFGLGAVPALLLAQLPARRLLAGQGPWSRGVRRLVPALAAAVVAWRAVMVHAAPGHGCH